MDGRRIMALGAVLVGVLGSIAHAQGMPPANVVVEEARLETLSNARGVTGEIRSRLRSELAGQVAGLVIEMGVEEGDSVTRGQVLARLDDERARANLERAQAVLASSEAEVEQRSAELEEAERDLERQKQLEERGSLNPAEMDAAVTLVASRRALLAQSRADLLTGRAELKLAERELEDMTIEAPFDGRVVIKHTEIGQWVGAGDAIATIVSMSALEARIDVPEWILWALEAAEAPVELRLPGVPVAMTATVVSVVPEADSLSRLFPVRLSVEDPERMLRPGMSLTAMVPTGTEAELLTVSKDAVLRNDAGEYVYYNNGGAAAVAPIQRLFAVGDRLVIRSPVIRVGMQVVVDGNERLIPSQPLMIGGAPGGGGVPGGGGPDGAGASNTESAGG